MMGFTHLKISGYVLLLSYWMSVHIYTCFCLCNVSQEQFQAIFVWVCQWIETVNEIYRFSSPIKKLNNLTLAFVYYAFFVQYLCIYG